MNVIAAFGQDDVIVSLFPKRGRQANVQFMWFSLSSSRLRVIPERVARLDALDERAKFSIQMGHILDVEDLPTRRVHHSADVDQPGNQARGEQRSGRIVSRYL